jgi:hypothetical protein
MSKHKAIRRRYYWWQRRQAIRYRLTLIRLWIHEQRTDLPDIIKQLLNK